MKIRVLDIPPQGLDLDFGVPIARLHDRLKPETVAPSKSVANPPGYSFKKEPIVKLHLDAEGLTVVVKGEVQFTFYGSCARCTDEFEQSASVPISLVLKPSTGHRGDPSELAEEDLSFGYYDGREIDCAELVMDFIILALPFTALCSESCKGLCPVCGINLNSQTCNCKAPSESLSPFAILRDLKIH